MSSVAELDKSMSPTRNKKYTKRCIFHGIISNLCDASKIDSIHLVA